MIRLRYISDPELREKVREVIAQGRDMRPGDIDDWWELDDEEYSRILIELRYEEEGGREGRE